MLYIASDHAGFEMKGKVINHLKKKKIEFVDLGTNSSESCDFPVYAKKLVNEVVKSESNVGILICGSGIGMSICANRNPKIRAALCKDVATAELARQHNDANVLVIAGRTTSVITSNRMVDKFLSTAHLGGKYAKRMKMIDED